MTAKLRLARAVQTLQADVHSSPASSRLNWRPRRFKCTRPFRRKTKSGFCACAITFQTQSTTAPSALTLPAVLLSRFLHLHILFSAIQPSIPPFLPPYFLILTRCPRPLRLLTNLTHSRKFRGFRLCAVEASVLQGGDASLLGNWFPTFRHDVSV
jgi:hypothetical protein